MPRGVSKADAARLEHRLWTPEELPNLLVWYDAADAASVEPFSSAPTKVARWRDKSGRGVDATGTNSFYCPDFADFRLNGLRGLVFGSQTSLIFTAAQTNVRTLIALCRWNTAVQSSPHPNYRPIIGHGSAYDFHGTLNSGVLFDTTWSSLSVRNGDKFINGRPVTAPAYYLTDTIHVFATTANVRADRFQDRTFGDRSFYGDYFELILMSSVITTADRLKVEGYLAHKWGIAGLVATHPYALNPPVL